jgi:adenosine deaminase
MGVTVHAGEWASAEGVRQAIEQLHADRIGHGVRSIENSKILQLVRDRQVALEVCLTSNLQTGVVQQLHHHPLVDLLNLGVIVTLNTDDPSISNLSLTDEYQVAVERLGLGYDDLRKLVFNAANASFLPSEERARLLAHFNEHLPASRSGQS